MSTDDFGKHWAVVRVSDMNEVQEFLQKNGKMGPHFDQMQLFKHHREALRASALHFGSVPAFVS